jgi:hypothetical protein
VAIRVSYSKVRDRAAGESIALQVRVLHTRADCPALPHGTWQRLRHNSSFPSSAKATDRSSLALLYLFVRSEKHPFQTFSSFFKNKMSTFGQKFPFPM